MAFKLVHISDIHLGPLPRVEIRQLLSKRITGYVNWHRNRAAAMGEETLARLTAAIARHRPDHVVVTGDLTNLALEAEIRAAALWLEDLGPADRVSVVPGNHDAYVRGALDRAFAGWAPWMTDDEGRAPRSNAQFPFVRVRGDVALIGTSSAVATPAFVAAGRFEADQAERLGRMLDETGRQGLFRVVLIHHPPVRGATKPSKRLYGIGRFQRTIADHGAELVLHGHTHLPQRNAMPGPAGVPVPVIGVSAAGQAHSHHMPAGAFNAFEIERAGNGWSCSMKTWSATTEAGPMEVTDKRTLWPNPA